MNLKDLNNLIDDNHTLSPNEIRKLRHNCNISQSILAEMVCCATYTVKSWEAAEDKVYHRQPNQTVCLLLKAVEKVILEEGGEDVFRE